jgi:hypothetical protein
MRLQRPHIRSVAILGECWLEGAVTKQRYDLTAFRNVAFHKCNEALVRPLGRPPLIFVLRCR